MRNLLAWTKMLTSKGKPLGKQKRIHTARFKRLLLLCIQTCYLFGMQNTIALFKLILFQKYGENTITKLKKEFELFL